MWWEVVTVVCNKCKHVEMKMEKVENSMMTFRCKQCGNEEVVSTQEIEKTTKTK